MSFHAAIKYVIRKRYTDKHRKEYYLKEESKPHQTPYHRWTTDLSEAKQYTYSDGMRPPVFISDFRMVYDIVKIRFVTEVRLVE